MARQAGIVIAAILLFSFESSAQLRQFVIKELPAPASIPLFTSNPNDAAIIIYSSIDDLLFSSNTGGISTVRRDTAGSKYSLLLKTEKQILTVQAPGFREAKLPVPKMNAKEVAYYSIEPLNPVRSERGRFRLTTEPSGARFELDGLPIEEPTPFSSEELLTGAYELKVYLPGYDTARVQLVIEPDRIVSRHIVLQSTVPRAVVPVIYDTSMVRSADAVVKGDSLFLEFMMSGENDEYAAEVTLMSISESFTPEVAAMPHWPLHTIEGGAEHTWRALLTPKISEALHSGYGAVRLATEETGSWLGWYVYAGGAAVVAGIVAALTGGSDEEKQPLADPPDWPSQ